MQAVIELVFLNIRKGKIKQKYLIKYRDILKYLFLFLILFDFNFTSNSSMQCTA